MYLYQILLIVVAGFFSLAATNADVLGLRTWTNQKNKTINASLVQIFEDKEKGNPEMMVSLKLKGGKKISIPLSDLSEEHQEELIAWRKKNPLGVAPPTAPYSWPRQYNGSNTTKIEYIKFDQTRQAHLYKTAHFDFYIDQKMSDATITKCVVVFDTIVEAIDALPMEMDTIPKGERPRYQAILVSNRETYMKMGGIPNSGGFFSPSRNLTVIPFSSLGIVKKGNNWVFDGKQRSFETLLHELTHHATSHWHGMPPWFQEGLAEYMSVMPYQSGRFLFTNPQSAVVSSIRKYKKYQIGDAILPGGEFKMLHVKKLMATSRTTWNAGMSDHVGSLRNYTSSMVLACYLMHEDGSGDGAHFIDWMHAWRTAQITKQTDQLYPLIEKHLLRGRSYDELEKDIQEKMRKRGLRLNFSN